ANLPAPAWPATKLMWLAEHDPDAVARAATVLMPKDWINFRLTCRRATDRTEASMSALMDPATFVWSDRLIAAAGLDRTRLPEILAPTAILGPVTPEAAAETGLPEGLPVLAGAGDYPTALLGSGVTSTGDASDVTGTSSIVTLLHDAPIIDPQVSNVATICGHWGALTLLDAGGDAVRWARRAFHDDALTFEEIEAAAANAPAGADDLIFLPYLSGERFAPDLRAQFFNLSAGHGLSHLHRAVLEGVAFSVRRKLHATRAGTGPTRFVAAGGGARSALWLKIKASMYGAPFVAPEEPECGLVGNAMMASVATGVQASLTDAATTMVRHGPEIAPDPDWTGRYDRLAPVFEALVDATRPVLEQLR
ncbi:MAG: FGGY family carbohydrate kinase, partial [Pseudomonadota bacterium]